MIAQVALKHQGCLSQLQERFEIDLLEVVMLPPDNSNGQDEFIVFLAIRGEENEKIRFLQEVKRRPDDLKVVFRHFSRLTEFRKDPTIVKTILAMPGKCFSSILFTSKLNHTNPIVFQVFNGQETTLVWDSKDWEWDRKDWENEISSIKQQLEHIGEVSVSEVDHKAKECFLKEVGTDIEIVLGLYSWVYIREMIEDIRKKIDTRSTKGLATDIIQHRLIHSRQEQIIEKLGQKYETPKHKPYKASTIKRKINDAERLIRETSAEMLSRLVNLRF